MLDLYLHCLLLCVLPCHKVKTMQVPRSEHLAKQCDPAAACELHVLLANKPD